MPKIVVTAGLSDTLKMLRMQNGKKAKDLAVHIGKTPGYITKLEKQEIKTIEIGIVEQIFEFILGDDYKKTETWEQICASLQIKHTKKEIKEELWFANFDTVHRQIPIPFELVDFINSKISELNVDKDILLKRINSNEDLSEEELKDEDIEVNVWYSARVGNGTSIKISLSKTLFDGILDKSIESTSYVFVFCILFYVLKIEKFKDAIKIDERSHHELYDTTTDILNDYKFYSILEREHLRNNAKTTEELNKLLTSFDNENSKLISDILNELKFASEIDVRMVNLRLSEFLNNLTKDPWFTLKLISLNYYLLEALEFSKKKEFVKQVEDLIKNYSDSYKTQKDTETY